MNLQKKILILLFLLSSSYNFAQEFNGFKYVVVRNLDYGSQGKDINGIGSSVADYFRLKGYQVIIGGDSEWSDSLYPKDLKFNICLGLFVDIGHKAYPPYEVSVTFGNCKREVIKQITGKASGNFENALKRIFNQLDESPYYSFDESLTPKITYPEVENINKDENELKAYFDSTKVEPIEGIYKTYKSELNLRLAIIKNGNEYKAISLEPEASHWKVGDVKIILESTSADGVFSAKWFMRDKSVQETFANLEGGLITVELNNPNKAGEKTTINLLKIYPKN